MIKRSKNITIIYGGRSKKYAVDLKNFIESEKTKHCYSLNVQILLEQIINVDILDEVYRIVKNTDIAVIFLSKDDFNNLAKEPKYRLRQNVVLEIGMCIQALTFNRCIFLADFDFCNDKEFEMPSDLMKICPTSFKEENESEVFSNAFNKIKELLNLKDRTNLIFENDNFFHYSKLFSKEDLLQIYQLPIEEQNDGILKLWLDELSSLDNVEQELIFVLERLPLLNLYRYSEIKNKWLNDVKILLTNKVNEEPNLIYRLTLKLISLIVKYTNVKGDYQTHKVSDEENYKIHHEIYDELCEVVSSLENFETLNNNILINAYDYLALEEMTILKLDNDYQKIDEIIALFNKCLKLANLYDDTINLWSGYLYYNLARAYKLRDNLNPNEFKDLVFKSIKKAITARKNWTKIPVFPDCFNSSLAYEYFIALIFQYNLYEHYGLEQNKLDKELQEIKNEFKQYIIDDQTDNLLLFEIKELIQNLEN